MEKEIKPRKEIIIDAEGSVAGRLATFVAKKLILRNKVIVVNSEKAIIIGNKEKTVQKWRERIKRGKGSQKGPYISKDPEKILRRVIRGMIKWRKPKGKYLYRNLVCLNHIPERYKARKMLEVAKKDKAEIKEFLTLKQLSDKLRGKK